MSESLELKCYLCDADLKADAKPFKIGTKEEFICVSCYTKTVNRRKALGQEKSALGSGTLGSDEALVELRYH